MRSYAKSIAFYERTRKSLAGGVSSNVRYAATPVPLFFTRGEGARLYDVDGNVHIDYVLGNGPAILGRSPSCCLTTCSSNRTSSTPRRWHIRVCPLTSAPSARHSAS